MNRIEFATRMETIKRHHGNDAEAAHSDADALIAEVLRSKGFGEGVDIYDTIVRWCA